jgi:glutaminyl-tRNA synthetase
VVTRFPPEPNGYLHIGHAKAMFVDFGLAKKRGGKCFLRFDDTNPEAESMEYINHIKEIVAWMGWEYCAITHSSDYFDQLYEFALKLIDDGKAYVCHQTAGEIKESREKGMVSPWRDRPIAESKRLFEDMRRFVQSTLYGMHLPPFVTCHTVYLTYEVIIKLVSISFPSSNDGISESCSGA